MSNQITESLFQAISTIAESHIANLQYDKTIICTITDVSKAKNNIYTVTDGSITFEAQGNGIEYKVNDNVRVLILEGDFTKTKYIQGKHNAQETDKPITYVSALDSILDLTDNMVDTTAANSVTGITANDETLEILIDTIDLSTSGYNISNNDIFNTLYIKGEFWSAFDQYEMRNGDYGIHLVIGIDNGADAAKRYDRLDLRLSALRDMFGNPYAFKIYTPQEIVCTLSAWPENAKAIYVYLYQNNNFEHYNYQTQMIERLPVPYLDSEQTVSISNIKVKNLAVGFGSEITSVGDNKLKIYTNNTQTFDHRKGSNDPYNQKAVQLLWYNKTENNEYLGFSDGIYVPSPGYDEDAYLAEISTDQRLLSIRDSKNYTTIPHDENCLDLQADINEISEKCNEISKLLGTTLWHTLDNFNNAIISLSTTALDSLLGSDETSLLKQQEKFDTEAAYLSTAYKNILEAAKSGQVLSFKNLSGTALTNATEVATYLNAVHNHLGHNAAAENPTDYYTTIFSAIETAKTTIQSAIATTAQYQDTYDSYVSSITRILNKIKKYAMEIHTLHTSLLNEDSGTNSTRLAALIKFNTDTTITIGNTYGSKTTDSDFVNANANRYCIYWYKKDVASLITDGIMPAGWSRMTSANNIGLPTYDVANTDYYVKKDESSLSLILSNAVRSETIKAVLFYNHEKIISNELVFTNDAEVLTSTEINLEGEIIIEHGLNSKETYQLYNEYGELNNQGDASKPRKLQVKYTFNGEEDADYLINAKVYWYVPVSSTLLTIHDSDKTGFSIVAEDQTNRYKPGYTGYYKTITNASIDTIFTYHIARNYQNTLTQNHIICEVVKVTGVEEREDIVEINETTESAIVDTETTATHTVTQYFNFSAFGNQGTDYTLLLTPYGSQPMVVKDNVIDDAHTETPLTIVPKLYDFDNTELTLLDTKNAGKSTALTFDGPSEGYELVVTWGAEESGKYPIQECKVYKKASNSTYWGMLKCAAHNIKIENLNKTINLISYMPVAYAPANTVYIEGANTVIYSSSGNNPVYCKSPYKLYSKATGVEWTETISGEEKPVLWKIRYYFYNTDSTISFYEGKYDTAENKYKFYNDTGVEITNPDTLKAYSTSFVPKLDKDNCLIVSNLYVDNLNVYPTIIAYKNSDTTTIMWAQSLLIRQNKHSSSMVNTWDGSLQMDEETNTILTSMIGAGRKNSNNEFEGVLMGDVITAGENAVSTLGLYGYNDGAQSFGFMIDGTGFIGKAGKGQILLNGDTSEIKSQSYADDHGGTGLRLDLDNGILSIKNNTKPLILLNAKDSGHTTDPLMYIKNSDNNTLLYIDTDEYYLSSANYVENTSGTKFNLNTGHIDAYNFKLTAGNFTLSNSHITPSGDGIASWYNSDKGDLIFNANNNFAITTGGHMYAVAGWLGGWIVDSTSLKTNNTLGAENAFHMYAAGDGSGTIAGVEADNWMLGVGAHFGVKQDGSMYASSGKIGGWLIGSTSLKTDNTLGAENAFHMYADGSGDGTIAGVTSTSWMLGIGTGFGVTNTGAMYSTSGKIGGWNIGTNSLTTGTLGATNGFYMYSSGTTRLSIGSHFSVDNTGAMYASAGNIAGFYINAKDLTIYDNNTDKNVLGFISKGEQPSDGKYAVGTSGLKQNWFIWNKGGANGSTITETDADGNVTAEGIKGVFGVDMDGNLYAMAGQIGPWSLGSTYLKYISGNTADDNKRDYIALSQDSIATKNLEATKGRLGYAYFGHKSNSNVYSEGYISQKTDYKCFLEWYSGSSASTSELTYWVGLTPSHLVRCSFLNQEPVKDTIKTIDWEKLIISSTAGQVDHVYDGAFPHGTVSLGSGLGLAYGRIDLNEDANFELYNVNTYLDGVLAFNIIPQAWGSADLTITLAIASGGGLNTKYTSDQTQANFAKEENFTSAPGWVPIVWNKGGGQGPRDAFYIAIGYIAQ